MRKPLTVPQGSTICMRADFLQVAECFAFGPFLWPIRFGPDVRLPLLDDLLFGTLFSCSGEPRRVGCKVFEGRVDRHSVRCKVYQVLRHLREGKCWTQIQFEERASAESGTETTSRSLTRVRSTANYLQTNSLWSPMCPISSAQAKGTTERPSCASTQVHSMLDCGLPMDGL